MTEEREKELRNGLMEMEKEHIVDLFIRLKKMYERQSEILDKTEEELLKKINLEELLDELDV